MGPEIKGVVSVVDCPEARLSSRLSRESVLRRDSTVLRPSGVGGAMEGLRVGMGAGGGGAMNSSWIRGTSLVCPSSRESCSE